MLIAKVVEEVFQELKEHLLKMSWGVSFLTKYTLKNIDQNNVLAYLQKSEFFFDFNTYIGNFLSSRHSIFTEFW